MISKNTFYLIVVLFMTTRGFIHAQNWDAIDVPIYNEDNQLLYLGGIGGLKSPQFSNVDWNNDGILDLFVFDRNANKAFALVKEGSIGEVRFRNAPEYLEHFPKMVEWSLLRDFNNDGVPDIFTSSLSLPGSASVYRGRKGPDDLLHFNIITFDYGSFRDILQFKHENAYLNIYFSSQDIPGIVDLDNDGDLDILSFDPDGVYAIMYKNLSKERGLGLDTIIYERSDRCWGRFQESQSNENILLSDDPFVCARFSFNNNPTGTRHSGTTLCPMDYNGDGLMDLVIGDIGGNFLTLLINGGTLENAHMTNQEINFPKSSTPLKLNYFPSIYHVDVDGDGKLDLVATSNQVNGSENIDHIWFYRNIGSQQQPNFVLIQKDFLIDKMPYFYSASHPAFADINADGLIDIVVGTGNLLTSDPNFKESRLVLLLNQGTKEAPEYRIENKDYLNFSKFNLFTGRFAPAFGDLDHDGDLDMLVGDNSGFLYYVDNIGGANNPMKFSAPIYNYIFKDLPAGQNIKPVIVDLDKDGLNDIVIGLKNTFLNFYKNTGSASSPKFHPIASQSPNTNKLGDIFPRFDFARQSGAPAFLSLDDRELMLIGFDSDNIDAYEIKRFDLPFERIEAKVGGINEGRNVVPSFYDIDNDGYYEVVIGNERGGLSFYNTPYKIRTSSTDPFSKSTTIKIVPNPANDYISVYTDQPLYEKTVYNLEGKVMLQTSDDLIHIGNLPTGVYMLKVTSEKNVSIQKLIISR